MALLTACMGTSFPAWADSPAAELADDRLLLVEVTLDQLSLTDALPAYQADDGSLVVPAGALTRLLDLDVRVQIAEGRITGSIGEARRPIVVDLSSGEARAGGQRIPVSAADAIAGANDIFLSLGLLQRLLPIKGDAVSTSTSANARWRVGVAKSPTVPTASSKQTNAVATVRKAITISKTSDLAFGAIRAPNSGSSVVTIDKTTGARTLTSGSALLLGGLTSGRALYAIGGQGSRTFTISVPTSLTLVRAGGGSLTSTLTTTASGTQSLNSSGTFNLGVGGALTVPSGTAGGDYSGTFTVTVSYN